MAATVQVQQRHGGRRRLGLSSLWVRGWTRSASRVACDWRSGGKG